MNEMNHLREHMSLMNTVLYDATTNETKMRNFSRMNHISELLTYAHAKLGLLCLLCIIQSLI